MAYKADPITGLRPKSGGRKVGSVNKTTSARQEAMRRVNEALVAMGDEAATGMKLLKEVLKHPDTPLDVRLQCAGLLLKTEQPTADEQQYVVHMPPALPGDTPQAQLAVWWSLYSGEPAGADPEWDEAAKTILEKAATKQRPETLS